MIFRILRRLWIPLLVLAVIGAGSFTVSRLHGVFGSEKHASYGDTVSTDAQTFDPKQVTYEVFGPPGAVAMISYFDGDGEPRTVRGIALPWSLSFEVTKATAVASLMAQGNSSTIGCRIKVNDEIEVERTSSRMNALTFCLLKSA